MIAWFEDLSLGMRFKGGSAEITEAEIKEFAARYDPQPFHLDDAAARRTMFKGLAASGWHTAAVAMRLAVETRPFGPHPLIGLGVEGLRWLMPVRPDDVVHLEGEVVGLTRSKTKHQGTVLVKWTLFNQNNEASTPSRRSPSCRAGRNRRDRRSPGERSDPGALAAVESRMSLRLCGLQLLRTRRAGHQRR